MSATPNILAVVREPSDFAVLAADLDAMGLCASQASSLEELRCEAGEPVNVVLCDADSVDWRRALCLFQTELPNTAVVFLTRRADEWLWLEMLEAGAYDLIEKPWRQQDLQWIVGSALKRRVKAASAA